MSLFKKTDFIGLGIRKGASHMTEQLGQLRGFCEEEGRDYDSLDISLIVPAISFGVGPLPPWGGSAYDDLEPVNAQELLAEYEAAGVGRGQLFDVARV